MRAIKSGIFILTLMALFTTVSMAKVRSGNTYYTRANIWYENPSKIRSTNYHVGTILPVGSKVDILIINNPWIRFRDEQGITYTIYYKSKFSGRNIREYLDFYFSEKNILETQKYKNFSQEEKENIAWGTVVEGMSKAAVLMAYGIPPKHRTPSTDLKSWTYWINRVKTTVVRFDANDTVAVITQ